MVNDDQSKSLVTIRELAHLLGVHANTLRRWSNQGIIKTHRIGTRGDRRFSPEDITHFLYELNENNGDESTE